MFPVSNKPIRQKAGILVISFLLLGAAGCQSGTSTGNNTPFQVSLFSSMFPPLISSQAYSTAEKPVPRAISSRYTSAPLPKEPLYPINFSLDQFTPAANPLLQEYQDSFSQEIFFNNTGKIHMVVFGDIMLGRAVRSLMNKNGLDYPFAVLNNNYLELNDYLLANLEGPIARDAVKTKKTIAFRFMPDVAPLLKKYHFDLLSLANNHALDMGKNGYLDTRDLLTAEGILAFGDPRGVNQDSVVRLEFRGRQIALIGLEDVTYKLDQKAAVEEISRLAAEGYDVIPYIHWGAEYRHSPIDRQRDLAHAFIDAGAYMVIGHHPHVVESFENYRGHPIFYSLGNAVFDQYQRSDTQEGLSLGLVLEDNSVIAYLIPVSIARSQAQIMDGEAARGFIDRFLSYVEYSADEQAQIRNQKLIFNFE